jgi:hypothetical protein
MIGSALPGIHRQEGDAVSIGHPAAEWKQPAATVHKLKQSQRPLVAVRLPRRWDSFRVSHGPPFPGSTLGDSDGIDDRQLGSKAQA